MKHFDLSNIIAGEMDKALDENKDLFSKSTVLEKLAFKKVSEEDAVSEVEQELDPSLKKMAQVQFPDQHISAPVPGTKGVCLVCGKKTAHQDEVCKCAESTCKDTGSCGPQCACGCFGKSASDTVQSLLKVSAALDEMGFEKLSAASLLLADKLVVEAKAKKDSKKSTKDSKEKSKSSKSKKETMKERMEKMRKMKNKKDDKKSSPPVKKK